MPFTPKDWKDYPNITTPIDAVALENIESRLSTYTDEQITALNANLEDAINDSADSTLDSAIAYVDAPITTNVKTGTSYTIISSDAGNVIVELTNNSLVTITLPATGFVTNAQVEFCALGTAGVTFIAGSGASIDSAGGLVDLEQNCTAVARHRGSGEWLLAGALS